MISALKIFVYQTAKWRRYGLTLNLEYQKFGRGGNCRDNPENFDSVLADMEVYPPRLYQTSPSDAAQNDTLSNFFLDMNEQCKSF